MNSGLVVAVKLCRHPQLRLRLFQAPSAVRANGFTKENVANFVVIFEPVQLLINISPHRLFNCGETSLIVVKHDAG
jgi:hypothetical protein